MFAVSGTCLRILNKMEYEMKIDFESLLEAWYECRKTKRRTPAAMEFEIDAEHNLYTLYKR